MIRITNNQSDMNKLFLWIAAASAFVLQSCENTDGIRDEIGSLRDRVIALEAKIGSVNTSIVALHKLMDESTIIVGIEPNAKGYETGRQPRTDICGNAYIYLRACPCVYRGILHGRKQPGAQSGISDCFPAYNGRMHHVPLYQIL